MRHFCTYFDENYLPRGLALYESLRRFSQDFRLWVLCLSPACHEALRRLTCPQMELVTLAELERQDRALAAAKDNRSRIEYYFTCTPAWPWFILQQRPEIDQITYLDSDLYFFSDPEQVFDEIGQGSVAITPHRFTPQLKWKEKFGLYNVGWLTFRRDGDGLSCLRHWREQCLEWCYDRYEDGRFADQKYLDQWPAQFRAVRILDHAGINTAPWNLAGCEVSNGPGGLQVNGQPLIVFHFHKVKQLNRWIYDPQWPDYHVKPNRVLRRQIYAPYIEHLERLKQSTASLLGRPRPFQDIRRAQRQVSPLRRLWRASPVRPLWYGFLAWCSVLGRKHFLVVRGRVVW